MAATLPAFEPSSSRPELLGFGASPAAALYNAAADGETKKVLTLLRQDKIDPNTPFGGDSALSVACRFGRVECAAALLANGARVEGAGSNAQTPLHAASLWGRADCVELLLTKGANVKATFGGRTALEMARDMPHASMERSYKEYQRCVELLENAANRNKVPADVDKEKLLQSPRSVADPGIF